MRLLAGRGRRPRGSDARVGRAGPVRWAKGGRRRELGPGKMRKEWEEEKMGHEKKTGWLGQEGKGVWSFLFPNIFLFSFLNSNQILKHDPNRIST